MSEEDEVVENCLPIGQFLGTEFTLYGTPCSMARLTAYAVSLGYRPNGKSAYGTSISIVQGGETINLYWLGESDET